MNIFNNGFRNETKWFQRELRSDLAEGKFFFTDFQMSSKIINFFFLLVIYFGMIVSFRFTGREIIELAENKKKFIDKNSAAYKKCLPALEGKYRPDVTYYHTNCLLNRTANRDTLDVYGIKERNTTKFISSCWKHCQESFLSDYTRNEMLRIFNEHRVSVVERTCGDVCERNAVRVVHQLRWSMHLERESLLSLMSKCEKSEDFDMTCRPNPIFEQIYPGEDLKGIQGQHCLEFHQITFKVVEGTQRELLEIFPGLVKNNFFKDFYIGRGVLYKKSMAEHVGCAYLLRKDLPATRTVVDGTVTGNVGTLRCQWTTVNEKFTPADGVASRSTCISDYQGEYPYDFSEDSLYPSLCIVKKNLEWDFANPNFLCQTDEEYHREYSECNSPDVSEKPWSKKSKSKYFGYTVRIRDFKSRKVEDECNLPPPTPSATEREPTTLPQPIPPDVPKPPESKPKTSAPPNPQPQPSVQPTVPEVEQHPVPNIPKPSSSTTSKVTIEEDDHFVNYNCTLKQEVNLVADSKTCSGWNCIDSQLTDETKQLIINELNRARDYVAQGLCTDLCKFPCLCTGVQYCDIFQLRWHWYLESKAVEIVRNCGNEYSVRNVKFQDSPFADPAFFEEVTLIFDLPPEGQIFLPNYIAKLFWSNAMHDWKPNGDFKRGNAIWIGCAIVARPKQTINNIRNEFKMKSGVGIHMVCIYAAPAVDFVSTRGSNKSHCCPNKSFKSGEPYNFLCSAVSNQSITMSCSVSRCSQSVEYSPAWRTLFGGLSVIEHADGFIEVKSRFSNKIITSITYSKKVCKFVILLYLVAVSVLIVGGTLLYKHSVERKYYTMLKASSKGMLTTKKEPLTTKKQTIPTKKEPLTTKKQVIPTKKESSTPTTKKQTITTSKASSTSTKQTLPTKKGPSTTKMQTLSTQKGQVTTKIQTIPTKKEPPTTKK